MIERVPKLFLQILQNRFELLSLELQEERIRVQQQIALVTVGALLGVTSLIGLGILIVFLIPPADRVLAACIIIALYLFAAVVSLIIARRLTRQHTPFEATLATLDKDIENT
ncbi:MAG: phage holin family protein [Hydrogenovibrio sp.]|uniref:phage holin family protein n=1 Tax=Hydrogenovibrio sp. TaxID=2065821 RepID=UPI002870397A|nr:phage holin family protein [Hydrogenovibrio sp.]MDR9497748.1 phage holin family protein [Hydrogenovibrio sp.]